MAPAADLVIAEDGGGGGVNGLNVGGDVLDGPLVAAAAAAGVEAEHQGAEVGGNDDASVGGAAVGVELLLREGPFGTVAPGVGGTSVVADGGDGEGIASIGVVLGTSIHLETSHIARGTDIAGVTVAAAGAVVAGGGVVDQQLQVFIGVVVLLGLEAEGHTQLGAQESQIGLRAGGAVGGAGDALVAVVVVAVVIGGVLGGLDGDILDVEGAAAGYAGAGGHAAVSRREDVAVAVENLEAVCAAAGRLVLVGISAGGAFGDGDGLAGLIGGEGQRAGGSSEVLALDGAEGDGAVVDGLGDGGVATAGDGEGAARGVGHREGTHLRPSGVASAGREEQQDEEALEELVGVGATVVHGTRQEAHDEPQGHGTERQKDNHLCCHVCVGFLRVQK